MNSKCPQCGTVNFLNATECVRCRMLLDRPMPRQQSYQVENLEAQGSSGGKLVVLFAVGVVAVCGYLFLFSGAGSPPANTAVANTAPAPSTKIMTAEQMDKALSNQVFKMDAKQPGLGPSQFDQKRLMDKSAEQFRPKMDRLPYVPPGQFGPPGAGVPYHTR